MSKLVIKENEFIIDGVRNPIENVTRIYVKSEAGKPIKVVIHCLFDEVETDNLYAEIKSVKKYKKMER